MRTRNSSPNAQKRWFAPLALTALAGSLLGCPNQELAPLGPCTVSGVSLEVPQSGVDKVDLLFMIDNSGSMAEEQKKLAAVLPNLVAVLTTGQLQPNMPKEKPDFPPVKSLHIGVISSDMGVNLIDPSPASCGTRSFNPIAPDPSNDAVAQNPPSNGQRLVKPFGDDGLMNISTEVAVAGISARPFGTTFAEPVRVVVPPDPACGSLGLSPNQRFIDFNAGMSNPAQIAQQFGCIAKLGKNGCGLEQQLEAALKAVTPSTSPNVFSRNTKGHGDVANRNFLRPDAILAVVLVTDEEDCSAPDSSSELFNPSSKTFTEDINIRCGLSQYQNILHPVARYVEGLKALKEPAYRNDRIIFAGIVGIPLNPQKRTYSGDMELSAVLNHPEMVFRPRPIPGSMNQEPTPSCTSPDGAGTAAPARRMVEVAKGFGENGVVTSICEPEYGPALDVIIKKIADQLTGACLPRKLKPNAEGNVECDVVEVKADLSPCDASKGRVETLPPRTVMNTQRTVCRIQQVPVLEDKVQGGTGWYYDAFSQAVKDECKDDPQRIAFTPGAEPSPGSQAKFECFQPVSSADGQSTGLDAINLACGEDNNLCASKDPRLTCALGSCQVACSNDSQCPESWLCTKVGQGDAQKDVCINPTCPQSAVQ